MFYITALINLTINYCKYQNFVGQDECLVGQEESLLGQEESLVGKEEFVLAKKNHDVWGSKNSSQTMKIC